MKSMLRVITLDTGALTVLCCYPDTVYECH